VLLRSCDVSILKTKALRKVHWLGGLSLSYCLVCNDRTWYLGRASAGMKGGLKEACGENVGKTCGFAAI
jgi:hypothetical protein